MLQTTQQRAKILVLGIMRGNALRRVARRARVAAKSLAVGIISRLGRLGDKAMEAPPIHNLPRPPGMMPGRGPPMMPGSGRKKKVPSGADDFAFVDFRVTMDCGD